MKCQVLANDDDDDDDDDDRRLPRRLKKDTDDDKGREIRYISRQSMNTKYKYNR